MSLVGVLSRSDIDNAEQTSITLVRVFEGTTAQFSYIWVLDTHASVIGRCVLPMVRKTASLWIDPSEFHWQYDYVSMEVRIKVGVFGLNLRLAPLILATINILWFWSSRALTSSVYASSGYIENRSLLGVMSRRKYHFSHIEKMITKGYRTSTLIYCNYRG